MDFGIACRIRFTRAVLSVSDMEFTARLAVVIPHLCATLERQRTVRQQLRVEIGAAPADGPDAAQPLSLHCRIHDCSDIVDPLGIGIECGIDVPARALALDDQDYASYLQRRLQFLRAWILAQRQMFVLQDHQRLVSLDDAMKGVELQYDVSTSEEGGCRAELGAIGGQP